MQYWLADAFTDRAFSGNPAAVVPLECCPSDAWMQAVAGEFNQSETAFCWPDDNGWQLRWFTPTSEVDLCGHATLATALVLWHTARSSAKSLAFKTRSGSLTAHLLDPQQKTIQLDFPVAPCSALKEPHDDLGDILGARMCWLGANRFDWLVELDDAAAVVELQPDLSRIATLPPRGIIVTARGGEDYQCDVVSRFFAPRVGVPEDPVTGSAHCALTPFWVPRLGKSRLVCRQLSKRGGRVETELTGERVLLVGAGVLVAHGTLLIDPD